MRPLRLEIEGFTSFRDRTEIDFTDADLFVLSGPMGAGKSSIIDAMGFALYGAISRFHNLSLVAPVISQGLQEARVRLVFRLGEAEYAATRVVRRNTRTGGASTPEARLTRGEELLAETAEDVTRQVTYLLGLSFDQFNRCVVLPQGEFAELLHARPSDRQELLVRLLDIGLYRRIGEAARERARLATTLGNNLSQRLENELAKVTEEAYQEQAQRVALLGDLLARLEGNEEALKGLRKDAAEHRAACQAAEQIIAALRAVKAPAGIRDFGERLRLGQEAAAAARREARDANDALSLLQTQRAELPERALVEGYITRYGERETLLTAIAVGEARLRQVQASLATATKAVEVAEGGALAAEEKSKALERAHSAYHASRELKAGDICPVCGEKLTAAPKLSEPPGLKQANNALKIAQNELKKRREEEQVARVNCGRAEEQIGRDRQRLQDADKQLAGMVTADECRELLRAIDEAEAGLVAARTRDRTAREASVAADEALATLESEDQGAWLRFNAARDAVAAHGAPAAGPSVAASWDTLSAWAASKAVEQETAGNAARELEESALAGAAGLEQRQVDACGEAGVAMTPRGPQNAVLEAKAHAEKELEYIDLRLAERVSVERDLNAQAETSRVAGSLGLHLNSTHFERWYLEEAMTRLVEGATARLGELSDGQYSLGLNKAKTDFVVVDHINANEERPVRTLSGGETFLASLALALALGDDIANLAAHSSARLDALFLDEGFGALDQNTLETVASAIEELGARGRMVGIVTHVAELADRIPVQFRVTKNGAASQVERVESR
ncbi:MAG: AAA family ATPase [Dehalococcoidia bacterium]|nr:AAA family ATPase [Dehalococcoidia bacterium]